MTSHETPSPILKLVQDLIKEDLYKTDEMENNDELIVTATMFNMVNDEYH